MANFQLISELLKKKRMTQKELACQIGITDTALRQIISRNSTKTEYIEKIAAFFQVPVGAFFGEQASVYVSGENNQIQHGNGNKIIMSPEQKEIEHLKEILAEKERLIQVLISKNNEM